MDKADIKLHGENVEINLLVSKDDFLKILNSSYKKRKDPLDKILWRKIAQTKRHKGKAKLNNYFLSSKTRKQKK